MCTVRLTPLFSEEFQELQRWADSVAPPYGPAEIFEFNRIYRRIYPALSREERRRAEKIVDALIDGVGDPAWTAKIYGVV